MSSLVIHFARFGPYHLTRLRSAAEQLRPLGWQVQGLQVCTTDRTYDWSPSRFESSPSAEASEAPQIVTACPDAAYEQLSAAQIRAAVTRVLDEQRPECVAVAGWATPDAIACLRWARRNRRKAVVMSETRAVDGTRVWWREWIKSRRVQRFDAALVGSQSHRDYLADLGMPKSSIFRGYNVVDNDYFSAAADRVRQQHQDSSVRPFFLASNRFVPIKNLHQATRAFAQFSNRAAETNVQRPVWDLCLLGDGPLRESVEQTAEELGLRICRTSPWEDESGESSRPATVYFPGFRQIGELPDFYARAAAFLHPASAEPWGLVINEAMASALPVVCSENVAAAEELLDEGVNGFSFDPTSLEEMAEKMWQLSQLDAADRAAMGAASRRRVNERVPVSAFGEGMAAALRRLGLHA